MPGMRQAISEFMNQFMNQFLWLFKSWIMILSG